MTAVWAGIDSGKRTHHCVVIDATGRVLLSQRVANDEAALLELIAVVLGVAAGGEVVWATDLNAGRGPVHCVARRPRPAAVLYSGPGRSPRGGDLPR